MGRLFPVTGVRFPSLVVVRWGVEPGTVRPSIFMRAGFTSVSKLIRHPAGEPGREKTGMEESGPATDGRLMTPNATAGPDPVPAL